MYKMKADGIIFYDPSSDDTSLHVLSPVAEFEVNKAGSLKFTLLPGNAAYNSMQLLKTIVTLEQDGETIFQGRVAEIKTDIYNQKEVYCEGTLSYLLDSVVRPYTYSGSAVGLLNQLVAQHNRQVEAHKQFTVGTLTAASGENISEISSEMCLDTLGEIKNMLIGRFGGYLRIRYSGSTNYLDYIDSFSDSSAQAIEFGVNLVDMEDKYEASDIYSVLVPIGGYITETAESVEPAEETDETETAPTASAPVLVTIASANSGVDYIEDAEAIAKYGRIVKSQRWGYETDPNELLKKARAQMARKKKPRTLTFAAVDLHIINASVDSIRLGDSVRLVSSPHGINLTEICAAITLYLEAPHQSVYTFGLPPQTLTDFAEETERQEAFENSQTNNQKHTHTLGELSKWITETDTRFRIANDYYDELNNRYNTVAIELDAMNATIDLKATQEEVNDVSWRLSQAEILIDGANAAIELKANQAVVDDLSYRITSAEIAIDGANAAIELKASKYEIDKLSERLSQAEIDIDGANARIDMKAAQAVVDELGKRVSSAELSIDGVKSEVKVLADTILLEGYVKADELEASVLEAIDVVFSKEIQASSIHAYTLSGERITGGYCYLDTVDAAAVSIGGQAFDSHSHSVTVNADGTISLGEVSSTGGSFNIADTAFYKDGVSAAIESVTLRAGGWLNGSNIVSASNGQSVRVELPAFSVGGGTTWVNNKTTVFFYTASVGGYLASAEVDATSIYEKGLADSGGAVTLTMGEWEGNQVIVSASNGESLTVDASSIYANGQTAGRNGVTLSAAGWRGGSNVVSASNGKSVTVSLPSFSTGGGTSWLNNKTTVYFYTSSVSGYLASREVDASSIYANGYDIGYEEGHDEGYDEGYAAGVAAAKANINIRGNNSITNNAPGYYTATCVVYVDVLGEMSASQSFTRTQHFSS